MNLISRLLGRQLMEQSVQTLLSRVTRRAEDLNAREQIASYVEARGLSGTLLNKDNKVIFGRRGTGKTHALTYVQDTIAKRGDVAIYLDMRKLGSNNSLYSDMEKPASQRATYALRDFVTAFTESLVDELTSGRISIRNRAQLDQIVDAVASCSKHVMVTQSVTTKSTGSKSQSRGSDGRGSIDYDGTVPKGRVEVGGSQQFGSASEEGEEQTGLLQYSLNFGNFARAVEDLTALGDFRVWLLLDEWSSLPIHIQPFFSDFLKRGLFVCSNVTVQIAAIEYRSKFRFTDAVNDIGFELGSDIFADTNLDDFFVYDSDKDGVSRFFAELFFRHLSAVSEPGEFRFKNAAELISNSFTQRDVFGQLVRAAEGVPRDFINIAKLAFSRSNSPKITMPEIRNAAKAWYERDKEANIDTRPDARALLDKIHEEIVIRRKLRAFLIDWSVRSDALEYLFDERIIHIARRSYSSKDNPGKRYRVWNLDFGCWVDLINTQREPEDLQLPLEEAQSGNVEMAADVSEVPADDYRAVRRAILDLQSLSEGSETGGEQVPPLGGEVINR